MSVILLKLRVGIDRSGSPGESASCIRELKIARICRLLGVDLARVVIVEILPIRVVLRLAPWRIVGSIDRSNRLLDLLLLRGLLSLGRIGGAIIGSDGPYSSVLHASKSHSIRAVSAIAMAKPLIAIA